jgi:small basic protein
MMRNIDISNDKTVSDLARESIWFLAHTLFAVILLAIVLGAISLTHPDPDSVAPKLQGTVLAFLAPMIGGFLSARIQQNHVARYVWISGLVLFSILCVWVLGLPTGNGLCESCGAVEKLRRTFFTFNHGSGLMSGDGLLAGAWIPLSMIGYAVGASFGLES